MSYLGDTVKAIRHGVPRSMIQLAEASGVSLNEFKRLPSTLPVSGGLNFAAFTPGTNGHPPEKNIGMMLEAYSTSPWLRAVVHRISHATAAVSWVVLQPTPGAKKEAAVISKISNPKVRADKIKQLVNSSKLRIIDDHPFIDLMTFGNPRFSGYLLRQVTQAHIDLTGESFWIMIRPGPTDPPDELWPLPPEWVKETPTASRKSFILKLPGDGEEINVPQTEILWFVDPNPRNPYGRGAGTTKSLGDEIDTDEYAAKHTKAWFFNRAKPEILVVADGLSKEETERLERSWLSKHQTFYNAFKAHFLNREVKVHELTHKFSDMELVELRKFERDTIVEVFGLPPEILGIIQNSNRATIDAADYIFARWVLTPRLELQRSVLQTRMAPLYGNNIILHYISPIEEDREFKLKAMEKASWAYSVDEWREVAGHEAAKKNGDIHLVPLNHIPVRDFGELADLLGLNESNNSPDDKDDDKSSGLIVKSPISVMTERAISKINYLPVLNVLSPIVDETIRAFSKEMSIALGTPFDMTSPAVSEFLKTRGMDNAHHITDNTKRRLRELLANVQEDGVEPLVRQYFAESRNSRSAVIGRSESTRSAGFACLEAIRQAGQTQKKWIADDGSRVTHSDLDGRVIGVREEFRTFTGFRGQHPGVFDNTQENANCRCLVVAPSMSKAVLPSFSTLRMSFETRLRVNLRVAFATQENMFLKEYRR